MKNILFKKGLVVGTILLFFGVSVTSSIGEKYENILIKNSQSSLEVIINVTGNGRVFHITTYIKNNRDENVTILFDCIPGGGFEIYKQNEELVYNSPKIVFWMTWELTLAAYQKEEIFNDTWIGIDNNWKNLPSGNYSVKGVVFTGNDLYSEPVNVYLGKLDNNPPEAPTIKGKYHIDKPGEPYSYKFKAIDPDNDDVRYYINWDDGYFEWTDYYPSGKEIIVNHTYAKMGAACISARANDTEGALGPWGYLEWSKEGNTEIEPIDNYDEIISFINGGGYIDWGDGCSGFIQHDFYVFSADIFIKAITKNPLKPFYTATANKVHMDLYIGVIGCGPVSPGELKCDLTGVAIGSIEWS